MARPNRTTFLALAVLHDAICRGDGPPLRPPEHGVRLALAFLWSIAPARNRDAFDELWKTLTQGEPYMRDRFRATNGRTLFARICIEVGVDQDLALSEALMRARGDWPPKGQPDS